MKRIILLVLATLPLIGCAKIPDENRKMEILVHCWDRANRIDYSKPYEAIKTDINYVMNDFDEVIKKYPKWNAIYGSKRLFLRMLYGENVITRDSFVQEYQKVFDVYLAKNKLDDDIQTCFQYGMFKKFQGKNEECFKILELVYDRNWKYTFNDNPSSEDIINFIAGNLLGQINKKQFTGSVYEQFFELDGEYDIFNLM